MARDVGGPGVGVPWIGVAGGCCWARSESVPGVGFKGGGRGQGYIFIVF